MTSFAAQIPRILRVARSGSGSVGAGIASAGRVAAQNRYAQNLLRDIQTGRGLKAVRGVKGTARASSSKKILTLNDGRTLTVRLDELPPDVRKEILGRVKTYKARGTPAPVSNAFLDGLREGLSAKTGVRSQSEALALLARGKRQHGAVTGAGVTRTGDATVRFADGTRITMTPNTEKAREAFKALGMQSGRFTAEAGKAVDAAVDAAGASTTINEGLRSFGRGVRSRTREAYRVSPTATVAGGAAGALFGANLAIDATGSVVDAAKGTRLEDLADERGEISQAALLRAMQGQRLQRANALNLEAMTRLPPHVYQSIIAGQRVPRTGIMIGEPRTDIAEELATAMSRGRLAPTPSLEEQIFAQMT